MRKILAISFSACFISVIASADTFGTGANQFTIDFVMISGDASSVNGTNISQYSPGESPYKTFSDPGKNYRMGTKEVTNDQWTKFKAAYGAVSGTPTNAYNENPSFNGSSVPTTKISWYEAVQFVNWLNTSRGYQAAYKFTGTIHTSSYTLGVWGAGDADGTNLYRNKNAKYFLPTENEWVKAAYWNGTTLQTYATKAGETLFQGNVSNGGWNYWTNQPATNPAGPWAVGSGSQELNGTYDMMGNVWEWMESPYYAGGYMSNSIRGIRGGSYDYSSRDLGLSYRHYGNIDAEPYDELDNIGFRVASIVPEPATLLLLGIGGFVLRRKK